MSKNKTFGMWCKPSSVKEWCATLEIADILELRDKSRDSYIGNPAIAVNVYGEVTACTGSREGVGNILREAPIRVSEFIAAMYAEAERRKPVKEATWHTDKEGNVIPPANVASLEQVMKQLTSDLEDRMKFDGPNTIESLARRVEKLEKDGLTAWARLSDSEVYKADITSRLSNLEELTAGAKPVTGSDGKRGVVIMERDRPLYPVSLTDKDYKVWVDPKASPSGIPFEVALLYLKAGRNVKRANSSYRIEPRGVGGLGGLRKVAGASNDLGPFDPSQSDLTASDWMVIPEEQTR